MNSDILSNIPESKCEVSVKIIRNEPQLLTSSSCDTNKHYNVCNVTRVSTFSKHTMNSEYFFNSYRDINIVKLTDDN